MSTLKKQIVPLLLLFTLFSMTLFTTSCSPYGDHYYHQQQNKRPVDNNTDTDKPYEDETEGETGGDDGTDDNTDVDNGNGTVTRTISIFSILRPDGTIDTELLQEDPEVLGVTLENITSRLPSDLEDFSSVDLVQNSLIRSKFSSSNVPEMWYDKGTWSSSDSARAEVKNNGPNTSAGSSGINSVVYYAYQGVNPLYKPDGSYNTRGFDKTEETLMDRFVFYRFTGKTAMPSLDNYLVAVDTYTKLFFSFAEPTEFKELMGEKVPTKWGAIEKGRAYKFYEYDPAGYVDNSGKFVNYDWYNDKLSKGNYDPVYTGKSPYTVVAQITVEGDPGDSTESIQPEISASRIEDGILWDETEQKYYTNITIKPQAIPLTYKLYRMDDQSDEWVEIHESEVSADESYSYRDFGGVTLKTSPRYMVEVYNTEGEPLLDSAGNPIESQAVEGSRMLSHREVLLGTVNSIRLSFKELWYGDMSAGLGSPSLLKKSTTGDAGTYYHGIDRNGFFGTNYRRYQRYVDFQNSPFILNGTFMKDHGGGSNTSALKNDIEGTWTHSGSHWPSDKDFLERTNHLEVAFGPAVFNITFNKVKIGNNNGNSPAWVSGTIIVEDENGAVEEFGNSTNFPFGFFMDDETFINALSGNSGNGDIDYSGVNPQLAASSLEDEILWDEDVAKYYTEIKILPQPTPLNYNLYRMDDRGNDWVLLETFTNVPSGEEPVYRDYNALTLLDFPRYRVEAFTSEGEFIQSSSSVEGSRMLTNREALLGAINSVRLSFQELWYTDGSASGSLKRDKILGDTGTMHHGIDRNGFFGTNYRRYQRYDNFQNTLFTLDGTFLKDNGGGSNSNDKPGTWTHSGSSWPSDSSFSPRTDSLLVTLGATLFEVTLNDVKISGNNGNSPSWSSGSISIESDHGGYDEFDRNSGLPFGFFMDNGTFMNAIGASNYEQQ